ncbi:MAG: hypothetical protein QOF51_498 [Chloroflexota bacterium]|jgi:predicted aspartyl protease|nr:hypothetical protein [Chloroflexota bacterium]
MARQLIRYKRLRGQLAPVITFGIRLGDVWQAVDAYVDSGAAYTVLTHRIAEGIGFDYKRGQPLQLLVGDGRSMSIYLHRLELQIGTIRFDAAVGFTEQLGLPFNVLGRADVFSRFTVCFDDATHVLSFDSRD